MKSVMDQDKSTLEDTNSDPQIDEDFEIIKYNFFNRKVISAGRFLTNPITASVLIITFGFWLFNQDGSNSMMNVNISALIEFTKGIFAFLAIFGSDRLYKKEELECGKMLSGAYTF